MTTPATSPAAKPFTPGTPVRGRFLWHELLTRDLAAATSFYPAVTGWTVQRMEVPGMPTYTMFARGETGLAGILPHPAELAAGGMPSLWMPYMGTDDVDATCRDAVRLGGAMVMPPMDIPSVGRIAALKDREGAQFAVIAPEPEGTPETKPTVGEFAWHEMMADDPDAALDFYATLFGWERQRAMDMGADGIYQLYGRGGFSYGGFMRRPAGTPPTFWNCYVRVADLDAAVAAIRQGGGRIVMGPHDVPADDRVVVATDDQGAVFSLVGARK